VLELELPCATVIPPEFDNEYVNELDAVVDVFVPLESVSMRISSLYMLMAPTAESL
jgi:hypothetical protein